MPSTNTIDLTRSICNSSTPPTVYPGHPPLHIKPTATIQNDGWSVHSLQFGTHTATHIDAPNHFIEGGRSIDEIELHELVGLKALVVDLSVAGVRPRQKVEWSDLEDAWNIAADKRNPTRMNGEANLASTGLGKLIESGGYSALLVHTGWTHPDGDNDEAASDGDDAKPAFFDHPYFSSSVARRLASPESKIHLFGSDTPNPDETPFNGVGGEEGHPFHHIFLGANGIIAENLTNLDRLAHHQRHETEEQKGEWVVSILPIKIKGVDGAPVRAFAQRRVGET